MSNDLYFQQIRSLDTFIGRLGVDLSFFIKNTSYILNAKRGKSRVFRYVGHHCKLDEQKCSTEMFVFFMFLS